MQVRSRLMWLASLSAFSVYAGAINVNLGTADPFAILAGSTVTNTGATTIHGDLGVWPGTSITGFPPGIVTGTVADSTAVAQQAQADLTVAYNAAAGQACGTTLTGQDLGGLPSHRAFTALHLLLV